MRRSRADFPQTKRCEGCGEEMRWPRNFSIDQWLAKRFCTRQCFGREQKRRSRARLGTQRCPVCAVEFVPRYTGQVTCRREQCKREYRATIGARDISARMLRDYAAGRRRRAIGGSKREKALWPLLAPDGWVWRLKWTEATRTFELDFALQARRLNVEIDGVEHREPRRLPKDAARDAELEERGWQVLRIPNEDVDADPRAVVERIRAWAARTR